jgi:hypothetical protein
MKLSCDLYGEPPGKALEAKGYLTSNDSPVGTRRGKKSTIAQTGIDDSVLYQGLNEC